MTRDLDDWQPTLMQTFIGADGHLHEYAIGQWIILLSPLPPINPSLSVFSCFYDQVQKEHKGVSQSRPFRLLTYEM